MRCGRRKHLPNSLSNVLRCALVLIVGLLLSPRRRAPWLSCDGCSAVPRRWARHMGGVNRPCTMALMLHGTAAGLGGGPGQLPPPSESHPSSAARARSASGASAKPSRGHASGVLPSDHLVRVRPGRSSHPSCCGSGMLAMSQDNRPFPGSPYLATPLGWRCGLRGASRAHLWSAGRSRTCPVVLSWSWIAASQMMLRSAGHQGSDQLLAAFAALTDRDRSHQNFPLGPTGFP